MNKYKNNYNAILLYVQKEYDEYNTKLQNIINEYNDISYRVKIQINIRRKYIRKLQNNNYNYVS